MLRFFQTLMLLVVLSSASGQIVFLNQPYDLGIISRSVNNYIDVPIKNIGNKKVFIFRADVDRRFQIHYSSKEVLPDSMIYMRVQFSPTDKGFFSEEIKVHFSCYTDPKVIKVTGFAEDIPSTAIACPSFSQQSINTSLNFELEVKVIDEETKEPIPKAQVLLVKNGTPQFELIMNRNGEIRKEVPLGLYYFVAGAEGYLGNEFAQYVNRNNNKVLIELKKDPNIIIEPPVFVDTSEIVETSIDIVPEDNPPVIIDTVVEEPPIVLIDEEERYPDFPLSKYKPNNIVFLVDVSSSMQYTGKLDLLKASMIQLTGMLRDIDKITIVSYANNANVLLQTTSGADKDTIISIIQSLEAKGLTAGGKGMKKAYQMAEGAFIKEGNNQVIMATDGGFNQGDDDPYKMAKKYKSKGISISVVGIKNKPMAELTLKKVVRYGDGNFIKITSYDQAQEALIEEVKASSHR